MSNHPMPISRVEAQDRIDRIRAFRNELQQLEQERIFVLPDHQRSQVMAHHDGLMAEYSRLFDVDVTTPQKQMSWGMRIVSFLGALAFAASVFFFFYRV